MAARLHARLEGFVRMWLGIDDAEDGGPGPMVRLGDPTLNALRAAAPADANTRWIVGDSDGRYEVVVEYVELRPVLALTARPGGEFCIISSRQFAPRGGMFVIEEIVCPSAAFFWDVVRKAQDRLRALPDELVVGLKSRGFRIKTDPAAAPYDRCRAVLAANIAGIDVQATLDTRNVCLVTISMEYTKKCASCKDALHYIDLVLENTREHKQAVLRIICEKRHWVLRESRYGDFDVVCLEHTVNVHIPINGRFCTLGTPYGNKLIELDDSSAANVEQALDECFPPPLEAGS